MKVHRSIAALAVLLAAVTTGRPAAAQSDRLWVDLVAAQSDRHPVELLVKSGRPLSVALDHRIKVKRVGQPVTGVLAEPVYAYDREVLPAGTAVLGHVARLERVSAGARLLALLNGDFTPPRRVVLQFDTLLLNDGCEVPIRTEVRSATPSLQIQARDPGKKGVGARARDEVAARARGAIAALKKPGRGQRLKQFLVSRLPVHPQYLEPGTVYAAVLLAPLSFGTAEATDPAPPGTVPAPESILHARLLTAVDSARTPRGTAIRAAVTRPLFSADHRLILPEGSILSGEVTFAKAAGRFHRNGQLRFLFQTVQAPEESPAAVQGSLYSVQASRGDRVAVDDEGGLTITNSKNRFVAPALAGLALGLSLRQKLDYDTDGAGPEVQYGSGSSRGLAGFFGLGLVGAYLGQVSRPVSVGLGVLGVARTVVVGVAGKGRNVSFPADTLIEVQMGAQQR